MSVIQFSINVLFCFDLWTQAQLAVRVSATFLSEKLDLLPELTIVLVGGGKTGKSSCGNTILNRECFNADNRTNGCAEGRGTISNKTVTVLDTPGCFPVTSDLLMAPSPCALLLVVNVSSSFKDANGEALEKQLEAGGARAWSRASVLFSYGDWLGDTNIEQRIESEGAALQRLVERCGNRYHVLDNKHWGDGSQVGRLMEQIEEMLVEERLLRDYHMERSSCSVQKQHEDAGTLSNKSLLSCRHQTYQDCK